MLDPIKFATDLVIRVGTLLVDFYNPLGTIATIKDDHTVVTEADLAADALIVNEIHDNFPLDEIISEESSHQIEKTDSPVWIIDPLDGTTNFSLGFPIWGISIARVENYHPSLGVIYFPLLNELYTAQQGSGAYLNNSPIHVRVPDSGHPRSFFACCSRSYRRYNISIPYKPRIIGSDAYTFCMVARGSALLGMNAASKIWDLAAGWLLMLEAGGVISVIDGDAPFPIRSSIDYPSTNFPILAAASHEVFSHGREKISLK